MARIIAGALTKGVELTVASDNPVTVAAGASILTGDLLGLNGTGGTAWDISNLGAVKAATTAISIAGAGTVHNGDATHASALAEAAGQGILIGGAGTVTNDGTVTATGSDSMGVLVQAGGSVENRATGNISGIHFGVNIAGASGQVTNLGTITGTEQWTGAGVALDNGGTVVNGAEGGTTARITGGSGAGVFITGGADDSVVNFGTIVGLGDAGRGVALWSGGTITNGSATSAGATIYAAQTGIEVFGGAGTVINHGSVRGDSSKGDPSSGVYLGAGGTVSNGTGGQIVGGFQGVRIAGAAGVVTNSGTISGGANNGILFDLGGSVTNAAGGLITGGVRGLSFFGSMFRSSVTNDGTITGIIGIQMPVIGATLVNGGSIVGTGGYAVVGTSGNNLVVVRPGAEFEARSTSSASAPACCAWRPAPPRERCPALAPSSWVSTWWRWNPAPRGALPATSPASAAPSCCAASTRAMPSICNPSPRPCQVLRTTATRT